MSSDKEKPFCCPFIVTIDATTQGNLFRAKCPAHHPDVDWQCPLKYTRSIEGEDIGSCSLYESARKK